MTAADPIAARYAQAVFETAKAEGALDQALESFVLIGRLLREESELRQLLRNPDVDPEDKVGILERIVKGTWPPLVRAFIHVVMVMGRPESLEMMIDAYAALVDEDRGRLRVTVRSARPLPEAVLERLRLGLEQHERKRIELQTDVVPELLGGLQVVLDHREMDGSVARQLHDLREQLMSVKVH